MPVPECLPRQQWLIFSSSGEFTSTELSYIDCDCTTERENYRPQVILRSVTMGLFVWLTTSPSSCDLIFGPLHNLQKHLPRPPQGGDN